MNSQNEILKYKYLEYLLNAQGLAPSSILKYEKAIHYYEIFFEGEDFGKYNKDKAISYREQLIGTGLAGTSIRTFLNHLKSFFTWLHQQPGYQRKIALNEVDYLNSSKKDNRLAAQKTLVKFPSHEQVKKLIRSFIFDTEVNFRNRALIALIYCTGMRDAAVRTLSIGCVDLDKMVVTQDPKKGVDVKLSKVIYSKIFPFDTGLIGIIEDWVKYLKKKNFLDEYPLFPKSKENKIDNGFSYETARHISSEFWGSSVSVRKIFKEAASRAKIDYFPPHSFRHAAILRALKTATNALELKAISQNFGHEEVATTMSYYGNLSPNENLEILDTMDFSVSREKNNTRDVELALKFIKSIRNH